MKDGSIIRAMHGAAILVFLFSGISIAQIVTYPAIPGCRTSTDFTMTINDTTGVWVENIGTQGGLETMNVANFSCAGQFVVKITASETITRFAIKPRSYGITGQINGKELTLTMAGPKKLYIEVNALPHLAIFANPLEVNPPRQGDANVVYYGPGVYTGDISLASNRTVYIAGGALINGNINVADLTNAKLTGRGCFSGRVSISNSTNVEFNGIFQRYSGCVGCGWSNKLMNVNHSVYRNVKVFSYNADYAIDGIDPCSCNEFTIDDCFLRCNDDCIAVKTGAFSGIGGMDSLSVTNCVMVGWRSSDGFTMGFEIRSPINHVLVRDCDVLYTRICSGGRTGGHSGFSIVCDGPALVQNVVFENMRVEDSMDCKNLELITTDGTLYGDGQKGHINGVYLKNCAWANAARPFHLHGDNATNPVENITFDHCSVAGKQLCSVSDALFQVEGAVNNISFVNCSAAARELAAIVKTKPPLSGVRVAGDAMLLDIGSLGKYTLTLVNISGAIVKRVSGSGSGTCRLGTNGLGKGVYFLRLQSLDRTEEYSALSIAGGQ